MLLDKKGYKIIGTFKVDDDFKIIEENYCKFLDMFFEGYKYLI